MRSPSPAPNFFLGVNLGHLEGVYIQEVKVLAPGHLASSYIVSQSPRIWRKSLRRKDIVFFFISGYILDIDILLANLFGVGEAYHHFLPTHTLLFAGLLATIAIIFLRKSFSPITLGLGVFALFSHLVLDDLGYWLHLMGLQEESKTPQIFWLYPFDFRRNIVIARTSESSSGFEAIQLYLSKASINVIVEIIFILTAILLYLTGRRIKDVITS